MLAIVALEVVLRCFFPLRTAGGSIGLYQYDEESGIRLRHGLRSLRTTDYQEEIRTNQLGTVNFQQAFTAYERRVFAIGDSFTQGTGLPTDASYPFQLDLQLNMHDGAYRQTYAVVNLGLAGSGLEQALIALRRYTSIVGAPHYVLYLGCANDYINDLDFHRGDYHRRLTEGNPHWGRWLRVVQWLTVECELGKRLKIAVRTAQRRRRVNAWKNETTGRQQKCPAALLEPTLDKLRAAAAQRGATLIVGWAEPPDNPSPSYQWLRDWAASYDVAFADWHPRVQSVRRAIDALPLANPHSGGHHRTWVNTMIATAFAEHIQPAP